MTIPQHAITANIQMSADNTTTKAIESEGLEIPSNAAELGACNFSVSSR